MVQPEKLLLECTIEQQRDTMLYWIDQLNEEKDPAKKLHLNGKIHGALIILSQLWSICQCSHIAQQIFDRLKKDTTNESR